MLGNRPPPHILPAACAAAAQPVTGPRPGKRASVGSLIILALWLLAMTAAARADSIILGGDHAYPPYHYLDKQDQATGFAIDLLQAIAAATGLQVQFALGPWARQQKALAAGHIDVLAMPVAAGQQNWHFTAPFGLIHLQAFARRDSTPIQDFSDLAARTVIVQRDSLPHQYAQVYARDLILVDSEAAALELLASGQHDYALVSQPGGRLALQRHKLADIVSASPPLAPHSYAFAVAQDRQGLRDRLNQGLARIQASGRFDTLHERWFGTLRLEPEPPALLHYLVWAFTLLALLTAAVMTWNWLLQRRVAQRTRALRRELAEHRQTEAALRASEALFRDITEASSDWIWEMDAQLRFCYFSERFRELTGIAPEQLLGHSRWELAGAHPDVQQWRRHRKIMEQRAPFRDFIYQLGISDRQGNKHYFRVSGKPIFDAAGQFQGYRGTGADISEQIAAETALRQSETRLRQIIDLVPHMIFAKDGQGQFLLANQAVANAYGVTVEALVGRPQQALHDNRSELARMLADDRHVIDSGHPQFIPEEAFTDFAGRCHLLQTTKIPFMASGASERAVLGIAVDITEQKRTETELTRMRSYLKNIIDSMPSVLVGVDLAGHITEWNKAAEQISGISHEAARGRSLEAVFEPLKSQAPQVRLALQQGRPIKTPRLTVHIHGEARYADFMVYPLNGNDLTGAVIRMDDVTSQVRMENTMVQTEKMLSMGGLAAGMAHEINNPLGAVLQGSQNILRRLQPDLPKNLAVAEELGVDLEQVCRYLNARRVPQFIVGIQEAGSRAAAIVSDMLAFSRRSEARFAPVNLREVVDTVLRLARSDYDLRKKYDFKRVAVIRDDDPTLGFVYCDKTEIEQVLLNLVKNAAQAMFAAATPNPTIILRTGCEADCARIEVCDNGPGMEEKVRQRIFEPFFTTKEVGVGTGLGLSVSYFIVTEQHHGTLSVISEPGRGACFVLCLPINRRERPHANVGIDCR